MLIYHDVVPHGTPDVSGFPGPLAARYKLTPETFREHLDALTSARVDIGMLAISAFPEAALTFDDGGSSALLAAEELENRGWRGHFFIVTSRIGTRGFMSADEISDLAERGHVVGSHSHTHPTYMGKLSVDELAREWRTSRDVLGELLGAPPKYAAVPGGFVTPSVIEEAALAGYRMLMTSTPTTRVRSYADMAIAGRYSIWTTTRAGTAAGYVTGAWQPRARLWLEWGLKQRAKRISPQVYEAGRRLRVRAS